MNLLNKFLKEEDGITAIEYAIIGVVMSAALYYIFSDSGFIEALSNAWENMAEEIENSRNIL